MDWPPNHACARTQRRPEFLRKLILSVVLIHLAACSGMQIIPVRDLQGRSGNSSLQIGDRVELATRNNEKLDFAVTEITPDGLAGRFGFIPYHDIRRLRVHRPGYAKSENRAWLWGVLGVAALIGLITAADSVTVCTNTPCPQTNPN